MKCFIGMGSSVGDCRNNIERAARSLRSISNKNFFRISPIYVTRALVPPDSPPDWDLPYLNAVSQIEWLGDAKVLLAKLKLIERELGRVEAPQWAPRVIDLDILTFGQEQILDGDLSIPHKYLSTRSFVLDPLKDLCSDFSVFENATPVAVQARKLKGHLPLIMGVINLTPDSFSDGGAMEDFSAFKSKIDKMEEAGVQIIDIGGESTRPGASKLTADEGWRRLEPALNHLRERYRGKMIRPLISLDTHRAKVAQAGIEQGVDWINDVSGGSDPEMLDVLKSTDVNFVLTHSLTVPADRDVTIPEGVDPVSELKNWLNEKLELLSKNGVATHRIIFDPGIGFGKTTYQSLSILRRINEFSDLPVRLLIGHSRKSFLRTAKLKDNARLDAATLGMSLALLEKGVDILRVHDFESHLIAFNSRCEVLQ